jgi:hypothetical protein
VERAAVVRLLIYVPSGFCLCGRFSWREFVSGIGSIFGWGILRRRSDAISKSHDGQEQFPMGKEERPHAASHWDGFIGMSA